MEDAERQELVRRYATWDDAALIAALTTDRDQYRPEALPLIAAELRNRGLPVPAPVAEIPPSARGSRPRKRLSWIQKGYLLSCLWIVLPVIPVLIATPFEHMLGWELNAGNSGVSVLSLFVIATIPTGLMAIAGLTIAVLVRRLRERRRL